ncbi:hypothetical protein PFFCH_05755 [Plasmodium falciparum FCH/4]|uniref:Uncharacterized protein n=1 Tax=Plasmodium falciparum FCH/4 TaxID=1036724 RepID=A0A024VE93_PLAFA|nr:hypothetical protein PFFCH_05755 [Plasmodium falciparum FCH/4]
MKNTSTTDSWDETSDVPDDLSHINQKKQQNEPLKIRKEYNIINTCSRQDKEYDIVTEGNMKRHNIIGNTTEYNDNNVCDLYHNMNNNINNKINGCIHHNNNNVKNIEKDIFPNSSSYVNMNEYNNNNNNNNNKIKKKKKKKKKKQKTNAFIKK